jgi:hypothetical protein
MVGLLPVIGLISLGATLPPFAYAQQYDSSVMLNLTTLPNNTVQINGTSLSQEDVCDLPIFSGSMGEKLPILSETIGPACN